MKYIIILFSLFIVPGLVFSQKLQVGPTFCYASIFYHKTDLCKYDSEIYSTRIESEFGVGMKMRYPIKNGFYVNSGFVFQPRGYNFIQEDLGFEKLYERGIRFRPVIHSYEIPIIVEKVIFSIKDQYHFSLSVGGNVTYNRVIDKYLTSNLPFVTNEAQPDTFYFDILVNSGVNSSFGADIYAGITFHGVFDLELSYQYALNDSYRFDYHSSIQNNGVTKQYDAIIQPRLSYFAVRFTVFPQWSVIFDFSRKGNDEILPVIDDLPLKTP